MLSGFSEIGVPADRVGEGLGARSSLDVRGPVVRNGSVGATREPGWSVSDQLGFDRQGRICGSSPPGHAGHGLDRDSGWPAGAQRLQRALRGHLQPSVVLFTGERGCPAAKLRPGKVHSTEDWDEVLLPEIERHQILTRRFCLRPTLPSPSRKFARGWKGGVEGRDPPSGQRQSGAEHRGGADAAGGATESPNSKCRATANEARPSVRSKNASRQSR